MSVSTGRQFFVETERKLREAVAARDATAARAALKAVLARDISGNHVLALTGAILIGIEQRRGCSTRLSRMLGILHAMDEREALVLELSGAINDPKDQVVIGVAANAALGLEYLLLAEGN